MRGSFVCIMAVLVSFGAMGCGHPSGKLVGAWEMELPSHGSSTDRVEEGQSVGAPVKILGESHFAFGSTGPDGRLYAGGGTYTHDGDTYTETVAYHFNPALIGRTLVFTCRIDGGRWYHSGVFDIDGERFRIEEIWHRIE